jgi:ribonuclease VapC
MFLDASAIVAVLGDEDDAPEILAKIERAKSGLFYSPLSAYEAVTSLARKKTGSDSRIPVPRDLIDEMDGVVGRFFDETQAIEMPITMETGRRAIAACKAFGRAVGHPAKLNLGDCFAYACARSGDLPLLFKGNDFPLTDIERA